jgi:2,4-dienoyl-CoA reductase-like NADH-dependent reductase (Old Yellow Enzyme family)
MTATGRRARTRRPTRRRRRERRVAATRGRSLLSSPSARQGGLGLKNRIWLPAMVTWRGTEDGFVTDAVREIYLRYAAGGAGMIVLEATGVRDVASGPLLRLSHDRFVPGLRACATSMRARSPTRWSSRRSSTS